MLMAEVAALVRRRWYLVLAVALLAGAAGIGAWTRLPVQYESQSTVVLLPPSNKEVIGENRLLGLGTIGQAVDVMIRSMTAREVRLELEGEAPQATYTVTPDFTSNAPLMVLTVSGDRDAVTDLMKRLQAAVPERLREIQDAVQTPDQWQIAALPVAEDPEPIPQTKAKMRTTVMLAGGVGLLGMLLVAGGDALLRSRTRRRAHPAEDAEEGDPAGGAEASEASEASEAPGEVVPIGRRAGS